MVLRWEKEALNSISSTPMATKTFCTASSREPGGLLPSCGLLQNYTHVMHSYTLRAPMHIKYQQN